MEPWGWIVVYLVGFTLFQLLLVRYFSDDRSLGGVSLESNEASPPQSGDPGRSVGDPNRPLGGEESEEGDEGKTASTVRTAAHRTPTNRPTPTAGSASPSSAECARRGTAGDRFPYWNDYQP
ncbi:hypothetical protein ACFQL4_21230 [Halosimplex aquaticum]